MQMRSKGFMLENAFGNVKLHTKTADVIAILIQGEARVRKMLVDEERGKAEESDDAA